MTATQTFAPLIDILLAIMGESIYDSLERIRAISLKLKK
jgi:hypothetical protein